MKWLCRRESLAVPSLSLAIVLRRRLPQLKGQHALLSCAVMHAVGLAAVGEGIPSTFEPSVRRLFFEQKKKRKDAQ